MLAPQMLVDRWPRGQMLALMSPGPAAPDLLLDFATASTPVPSATGVVVCDDLGPIPDPPLRQAVVVAKVDAI